MNNKKNYVKPDFNLDWFTCFECNEYTKHSNIKIEIATFSKKFFSEVKNEHYIKQPTQFFNDFGHSAFICNNGIINETYVSLFNKGITNLIWSISICQKCGSRVIWEKICKFNNENNNSKKNQEILNIIYNPHEPNEVMNSLNIKYKLLYPNVSSVDIEPNIDMSDVQKELFNEAKNIFDKSPKAAGALLRCVIENMLRNKYCEKHSKSHLGVILKDENISIELGEEIIKCCEVCKLIGNDAVHSSMMIYEDESKEEVKLLFELINLIADELISKPKNKQNLIKKSIEIKSRKNKI